MKVAWEAVAHPGQGDVVGVLEGVVADGAGRPHAVGRDGHDLQEEHSVGGRECGRAGSSPAARAGAEAEQPQARVLRVHERQDVAVLRPHAPHDLPHLRHCHEARPAQKRFHNCVQTCRWWPLPHPTKSITSHGRSGN